MIHIYDIYRHRQGGNQQDQRYYKQKTRQEGSCTPSSRLFFLFQPFYERTYWFSKMYTPWVKCEESRCLFNRAPFQAPARGMLYAIPYYRLVHWCRQFCRNTGVHSRQTQRDIHPTHPTTAVPWCIYSVYIERWWNNTTEEDVRPQQINVSFFSVCEALLMYNTAAAVVNISS